MRGLSSANLKVCQPHFDYASLFSLTYICLDRGIVVFTGCSHAGVVNASKHAITLGEGTPLYAVMGGYHLADSEPGQIVQTIGDLMALKPKILVPGHCTGWRAKYKIEEMMGGKLAPSTVGTRFTL